MRGFVLLLAISTVMLGAVPARADTADELLAASSALIEAKKYPEAATKLDTFLAMFPKHPKVGAAALALGECRSELKQYDKAIPAYEKAIATKEYAVVAPAQLRLGEAAMYAQQFEKAVTALEAALKLSLKSDQAALAWYWLGQANFQLQKFEAADTAYMKVIRDYPRSDFVDGAAFGAASVAMKLNKTELARQRFRLLVDRFPKSEDRPQALLLLAEMDLTAKRYREARAGFEAAMSDPQIKANAEALSNAEDGLLRTMLEMGDYAAATSRLQSVITRLPALDKQRYRAQLTLGHCYYRQKQYDVAYPLYLESAKSTEGVVAGEGHYWAANSALALSRPTDAAVQFTKVFTRFPKHELAPRAQLKAGDAYLAAKQTDAAVNAYRAVREKYPQSPEVAEAKKALAELVESVADPVALLAALKNAPPAERAKGMLRAARLYVDAKKCAEATTLLTELQKTKPDTEVAAEAQYVQGLIYEAQTKLSPAAGAFNDALRRNPNATWAADAQTRLAWLSLELKQPANAERAAIAALALKPSAAIELQARLALVQAQLDQEKYDAALEGCKALLARKPSPETVATVLFTQAWVSEKQGKPDAPALWERLANEYPKSSYADQALLHLADARFKTDKYEEARAKYAELLKSFPKSRLAPEARFKLGSALYNLEKFLEAGAEFDAVTVDKSAGDYIPEAYYWAGLALDKGDKKMEAIQRLSKLVTQFPTHARVANAKIHLAALKALVGK